CRIAAEADDRIGPMIAVQALGLSPALHDGARRLQPTDGTSAEPPGRKDVHGHALEQAGEARAALVGDQEHAVAAGLELRSQRVRRNHMSTGSTGGENEIHAGSDSPLHFTTYGERVR